MSYTHNMSYQIYICDSTHFSDLLESNECEFSLPLLGFIVTLDFILAFMIIFLERNDTYQRKTKSGLILVLISHSLLFSLPLYSEIYSRMITSVIQFIIVVPNLIEGNFKSAKMTANMLFARELLMSHKREISLSKLVHKEILILFTIIPLVFLSQITICILCVIMKSELIFKINNIFVACEFLVFLFLVYNNNRAFNKFFEVHLVRRPLGLTAEEHLFRIHKLRQVKVVFDRSFKFALVLCSVSSTTYFSLYFLNKPDLLYMSLNVAIINLVLSFNVLCDLKIWDRFDNQVGDNIVIADVTNVLSITNGIAMTTIDEADGLFE